MLRNSVIWYSTTLNIELHALASRQVPISFLLPICKDSRAVDTFSSRILLNPKDKRMQNSLDVNVPPVLARLPPRPQHLLVFPLFSRLTNMGA